MVSKNNHQQHHENYADKVCRYGIKKLSVGVASVAIASGLVFVSDSAVAKAAADADLSVASAEAEVSVLSSDEDMAGPVLEEEASQELPVVDSADAVNAADQDPVLEEADDQIEIKEQEDPYADIDFSIMSDEEFYENYFNKDATHPTLVAEDIRRRQASREDLEETLRVEEGSSLRLPAGENNPAEGGGPAESDQLKDNQKYTVMGKQEWLEYRTGELPDASTAIANSDVMPAGTTYAWKDSDIFWRAGTHTTAITATFPDGSTQDVQVAIWNNYGYEKDGVDYAGVPLSALELPQKELDSINIGLKIDPVSDIESRKTSEIGFELDGTYELNRAYEEHETYLEMDERLAKHVTKVTTDKTGVPKGATVDNMNLEWERVKDKDGRLTNTWKARTYHSLAGIGTREPAVFIGDQPATTQYSHGTIHLDKRLDKILNEETRSSSTAEKQRPQNGDIWFRTYTKDKDGKIISSTDANQALQLQASVCDVVGGGEVSPHVNESNWFEGSTFDLNYDKAYNSIYVDQVIQKNSEGTLNNYRDMQGRDWIYNFQLDPRLAPFVESVDVHWIDKRNQPFSQEDSLENHFKGRLQNLGGSRREGYIGKGDKPFEIGYKDGDGNLHFQYVYGENNQPQEGIAGSRGKAYWYNTQDGAAGKENYALPQEILDNMMEPGMGYMTLTAYALGMNPMQVNMNSGNNQPALIRVVAKLKDGQTLKDVYEAVGRDANLSFGGGFINKDRQIIPNTPGYGSLLLLDVDADGTPDIMQERPRPEVTPDALNSDTYTAIGQNISTLPNVVPDAKDGIANKESLPEGTTYSWEKRPEVGGLGSEPVNANVIVTYPDGSQQKVPVTITVLNQAEYYKPQAKPLIATVGGEVPTAADGIYFNDPKPAETPTVAWTEGKAPDLSKVAKVSGEAKITYTDQSTGEKQVPVYVVDAKKANPVAPNTDLKDKAKDYVDVPAGGLPEGTTFTWKDSQAPDTAPQQVKPGSQQEQPADAAGTVVVTLPGGSSTEVAVTVPISDKEHARFEPVYPKYEDVHTTPGTEVTIPAPQFEDKDGQLIEPPYIDQDGKLVTDQSGNPKVPLKTATDGAGVTTVQAFSKPTEGVPAEVGSYEVNPATGAVTFTPAAGLGEEKPEPVDLPVLVTYSDDSTDTVTAKVIVDKDIYADVDPDSDVPLGYIRQTFQAGDHGRFKKPDTAKGGELRDASGKTFALDVKTETAKETVSALIPEIEVTSADHLLNDEAPWDPALPEKFTDHGDYTAQYKGTQAAEHDFSYPTAATTPDKKVTILPVFEKDGQSVTNPPVQPTGAYALDGNVPGASIENDTGEITYTPTEGQGKDQPETVEIPVTVTYQDGSKDQTTAKVIVGKEVYTDVDPKTEAPEGYVRIDLFAGDHGTFLGEADPATGERKLLKDQTGKTVSLDVKKDTNKETFEQAIPEIQVDEHWKRDQENPWDPALPETFTAYGGFEAQYQPEQASLYDLTYPVTDVEYGKTEASASPTIKLGDEVQQLADVPLKQAADGSGEGFALDLDELDQGILGQASVHPEMGIVSYKPGQDEGKDAPSIVKIPVKLTYEDGSVGEATATFIVGKPFYRDVDPNTEAPEGYVRVTLNAGAGKFDDVNDPEGKTVAYDIRKGTASSAVDLPKVTPPAGYRHSGWNPALPEIFNAGTAHTATYQRPTVRPQPVQEQTAKPSVDPVKADDTELTGAAEEGAAITVTLPDGSKKTATADETGKWTVALDKPAKPGDSFKVVAKAPGKTASEEVAVTVPAEVVETSEQPTVNPVEEGDQTISGTAGPGAKVDVTLPDGTKLTTTADDQGKWTVGVPTSLDLKPGDTITVTASEDGKKPSAATTTTVKAKGEVVAPTFNPVHAGDKTIGGTAGPGASVEVTFPDGTKLTATADDQGKWIVEVPADHDLKAGDELTAIATDAAGRKSELAKTTVLATEDSAPAPADTKQKDDKTAKTDPAKKALPKTSAAAGILGALGAAFTSLGALIGLRKKKDD